MAVNVRNVTGTYLHEDGSTVWAGNVTFRIVPLAAYISGDSFPQDSKVVTLDGAGKINGSTGQPLWCSADGLTPTFYECIEPDGNVFYFSLIYVAATPIDITALKTAQTRDLLDFATARLAVILNSQYTVDPALTEIELDKILIGRKRAATWAASTLYKTGDIVIPSIRNQKKYRCFIGGTSGTTEPVWPIQYRDTVLYRDGYISEPQVETAPALTWQECGPDPSNIYDIRGASFDAWHAKAAKASSRYNIGVGNAKYDRMGVMQNCLTMADRYQPIGF